MKYYVNLKSVEDAAGLVKTVSKYDCDVELVSGRFHVDAKSIIGVLGVALGRHSILLIHDSPDKICTDDLREYIA